jgi:hypothetical protein
VWSNPDYDFPCNQVFWESDANYQARREAMARQRDTLKEKYSDFDNLSMVVEAEERLLAELTRFNDTVYGIVADAEFKKTLDCRLFIEKRLVDHKLQRERAHDAIKDLRKWLSEHTR